MSSITLHAGISQALQAQIPAVKEVIPIEEDDGEQ
jgi:Fe-S cluster biogenesis protein NfuA